jgi:hypothetical protein
MALDVGDIRIDDDGSAARDPALAHLDPAVALVLLNLGSDRISMPG